MQADISIFLALGAGVLTFLSPCVFPLYPAFLSHHGIECGGNSKWGIKRTEKGDFSYN